MLGKLVGTTPLESQIHANIKTSILPESECTFFWTFFRPFFFYSFLALSKHSFYTSGSITAGGKMISRPNGETKSKQAQKRQKFTARVRLEKRRKCSFQNLRRHQLFDKCASHPNCKDSVPEHRKPNCHTTLGFLRKKSLILRSRLAHATLGQMLSAGGNFAKKRKKRSGRETNNFENRSIFAQK